MSEILRHAETIGAGNSFADMANSIRDEAPIEAKKYFRNARNLEIEFRQRNEIIQDGGGMMSREEFERWENDLAFEMGLADRKVEIGEMNFAAEAAVKQEMVAYYDTEDIADTIEAQAGKYFYERERELEIKLTEQGDEDGKRLLRSFYQTVARHLDFKYMEPKEQINYGYESYDRQRTKAHNEVIKHLNAMNDLAREYGTRPFMVRNLWPSDMKSSYTRDAEKIIRYDRHIAEKYYTIAFGNEEASHQKARGYLSMVG